MTLNQAKKAVVDPAIYSSEYFLTDNEGWREYADSLDANMHPKFARALELADPSGNDTILDIGCGRGELLYYCAKRGAKVTGLDYSAAAVEIAGRTIRSLPPELQKRACVRMGDPTSYNFEEKLTIVFMIDTLEHMHNWQLEEALERIRPALADGGRLIIITPNHLYEKYLSPIKRLLNLPLNLIKLPLRMLGSKYRRVGFGPLLRKAFRIRQDRGQLNKAMHVNVTTPSKVKMLLKAFDAEVVCEDPSKNIVSLATKRWWGRNIIAIARKR